MSQSNPDRCPARPARPFAFLVLAMLLVFTAMLSTAASAQAYPRKTADAGTCVRRDVAVTSVSGRPAPRYRIAGWLCTPPRPTDTVQLLLSGYTYSHIYWTTPGTRTNWVADAMRSGQAVYMIDRIGTGASDRAPADQITADSEAFITHQIVTGLRAGPLGEYRKVVGVGHSYGSIVWMAEAAAHHDVDALVLTGMLHELSAQGITAFAAALHPAAADPKFAAAAMPEDYLTTRPGTRASFFLDPATATPGAATWDENTKSTGTTGELTFTPEAVTGYSRQIRVPVLTIIGARDVLLCTPDLPCGTATQLCHRERSAYAPQTPLYAATIPQTGHSITLHRSAPAAAGIANRWITHHTARSPAVTTCTA